jgi:hypothetical protein
LEFNVEKKNDKKEFLLTEKFIIKINDIFATKFSLNEEIEYIEQKKNLYYTIDEDDTLEDKKTNEEKIEIVEPNDKKKKKELKEKKKIENIEKIKIFTFKSINKFLNSLISLVCSKV